MAKWFIFIAFAITASIGAESFAQAAELMSTHPSHYADPGAMLQGRGSSITQQTRQARAGSRTIVRDGDALLERWQVNPQLSRACNERMFRQRRDQYLIGVVDGRTYGAAVGGHGSLIDRAKMAENQVVYLFRGQGTTDCRVYHRTR